MKCPFCSSLENKVIDSRVAEEGDCIRRRRHCIKCLKRFTTYERYEAMPLMVIKKDVRREPFDRQKLLNGILKACEKTSISLHSIEQLVSEIEEEARAISDGEVASQEIGSIVIKKLKKLDEVAYVRFASVYKEFKDASEFIGELKALKDLKKESQIVFKQPKLPLEEDI